MFFRYVSRVPRMEREVGDSSVGFLFPVAVDGDATDGDIRAASRQVQQPSWKMKAEESLRPRK